MEQIGYFLWEVSHYQRCSLPVSVCWCCGAELAATRHSRIAIDNCFSAIRKSGFPSPGSTNFGIAVFLCYFAGFLEYLLLERFGASILATAQLITFFGIVKISLC